MGLYILGFNKTISPNNDNDMEENVMDLRINNVSHSWFTSFLVLLLDFQFYFNSANTAKKNPVL